MKKIIEKKVDEDIEENGLYIYIYIYIYKMQSIKRILTKLIGIPNLEKLAIIPL